MARHRRVVGGGHSGSHEDVLLDDGALFVYGLTYLWTKANTLTAGIITGAAVTALAALAWVIHTRAPPPNPANPRPSDRTAFTILATSLGASLGAGLGALALVFPALVAARVVSLEELRALARRRKAARS